MAARVLEPGLAEDLASLQAVFFDFDGVFTDNRVWTDQSGTESVACWRSDGLGLARLKSAGVPALILSTEANPVVAARARKLGLECRQGLADKRAELLGLCADRGWDPARVAFVGNDINDLGCLSAAGVPAAPRDAYPEAQAAARLVLRRRGGYGAVREFCDLVADCMEAVR